MSRILPDFICKATDFQLVFNFEQTRTVTDQSSRIALSNDSVLIKPVIHSLEIAESSNLKETIF